MTHKVTTRAGRRVYRGAPKPLPEGACPHCARVIGVSPRGRRNTHTDGDGNPCTGSGIPVEIQPLHLAEIPPIRLPADRVPADKPTTQPGVIAADGHTVSYAGHSDRDVRHGRAECPNCGRHLPLNRDGTLRAHRTAADDPLAARCVPAPMSAGRP